MVYPYKLTEFGSFFIDSKLAINDLKNILCDQLKMTLNIELNREFVLIRENLLEKPTKVN